MAAYDINCPHCGGTLEVQEDWSGVETECPLCQNAFVIPPRKKPPAPAVRCVEPPPAATYSIDCPRCGGILEVQEEWAGLETNCPFCQRAFVIPPPQKTPAQPSPVPFGPAASSRSRSSYDGASDFDTELYLYGPVALSWGSFLFGPTLGSWCVWRNYKTLGDSVRAKRALNQLVFYLIGNFVLSIFLSWVGTLILLAIWHYHVGNPHRKFLEENGFEYRKKSWLLPGLAIIAIYVVFLMILGGIAWLAKA